LGITNLAVQNEDFSRQKKWGLLLNSCTIFFN
jgi:hypothetical protein